VTDDASRGSALVARTLRAALAAEQGGAAPATDDAAARPPGPPGSAGQDRPPHPAAPPMGASAVSVFAVTAADTAAAMGHPDPAVTVLGTPRLGLWFEIASSPLMPAAGSGLRHVGVGLVVHHLAAAAIGEEVAVRARVVDAAGRSVVFAVDATVGERCVARGVHHRRIVDAPSGT
jgi:predicted thioesterase